MALPFILLQSGKVFMLPTNATLTGVQAAASPGGSPSNVYLGTNTKGVLLARMQDAINESQTVQFKFSIKLAAGDSLFNSGDSDCVLEFG